MTSQGLDQVTMRNRPPSYFDDNFVAPLASMEDLSVLMTPMSTPGPTPGTSPKTRSRWSHRLSSGTQFEPLPPINDDTILEFPILPPKQQQQLQQQQPELFPRRDMPPNLLRKSLSNNRRNYPACPCMISEEKPSNLSPTQIREEKEDFRRIRPRLSNGHTAENNERKRDFSIEKPSTANRVAFPVWRPDDVIEVDERRRILDDSDYPFVRPRDVINGFEDEDKRRLDEDSDYPFVRPRQVHFLPATSTTTTNSSSSPRNQRVTTKSDLSSRSSPIVRRESASRCDTASPIPSRVSPEFSSLIRANGGSLQPCAMKPPTDRLNLIYLTLVLHGVGSLLAWNMFMTAKESMHGGKKYMLTEYFVNYKLSKEYTYSEVPYSAYFMQFIGIAAQVPNVVFNWVNIFLNIGGTLTSRIVWTLLIEVLVFVATIILAMVDSSDWPGLFFYLTFGCVVILNMANGIYQNTVYGVAAKLPFKYTGAVVLGSNLSGTIVALINLLSIWMSPNPRTAAIYYFITALFILLACFDTYFALPLNRFYRYHDHLYTRALQEKKKQSVIHALPYWKILKQSFPQCFNVFFTYFVTLTIFPAVYADVKISDEDFFISEPYFTAITCFLTFNVFSVIGNIFPSACRKPGPRWLFIPVLLRLLFLPFFLFCNYQPGGLERLWPKLIYWDYAYWAGGALLGLSGGYLASLGMMYCPRSVEPEYASVAGMFGAASIVTGIVTGLIFSHLMPLLVTHPVFAFDMPEWWPRI